MAEDDALQPQNVLMSFVWDVLSLYAKQLCQSFLYPENAQVC